jgi:DNA-binding transcriptional ArsR family regulator
MMKKAEGADGFWETRLQQVMLFLCRHPEQEFYGLEIAKKSGVTRSAANYALRDLAERGWVHQERRGRMSFYRARLGHPLVRQVKVLDTLIGLDPVWKRLFPLSERVILFGSAAEGRNVQESDLDLLVVTNRPEEVKRAVRGFPGGLQVIVKDPLGWAKMAKSDPAFVREAERGVVLWQKP